ncbi:hypothetical protein M8J75_002957 [Diaphorina citri]|nr:hypothetical protein M8J75_002957 [Diaphorina citri]
MKFTEVFQPSLRSVSSQISPTDCVLLELRGLSRVDRQPFNKPVVSDLLLNVGACVRFHVARARYRHGK